MQIFLRISGPGGKNVAGYGKQRRGLGGGRRCDNKDNTFNLCHSSEFHMITILKSNPIYPLYYETKQKVVEGISHGLKVNQIKEVYLQKNKLHEEINIERKMRR